jgi:heat shock protein HslJ
MRRERKQTMTKKLKIKSILVILMAVFVFSACAPFASPKENVPLEPLYSGTWRLVAYGNKDKTENVLPGLPTFIAFEKDGSLHGNAGCNNFFGSFEAAEDGSFSLVEPVGSTLMYCEDFMEEETAFMTAIQSARSFSFNEEGQLVIKFKESDKGFDFLVFDNKQSSTLFDTVWELSSLLTPDGEINVLAENAPALVLADDNNMTGNGGCNNIWSEFVALDGEITFGPVASTMMFCEGLMELEDGYTRALEAVTRYEIIEDRLTLSDEGLSTVMTFTAAEGK